MPNGTTVKISEIGASPCLRQKLCISLSKRFKFFNEDGFEYSLKIWRRVTRVKRLKMRLITMLWIKTILEIPEDFTDLFEEDAKLALP